MGVARDGEHGEALVGRVDAHEDDRVGAEVLLAGAAVGAEEQHVVGIGRCCRLGEDRTELVVDDLLVVQALVKRFDPVHGGEGGPAQRREERDHDERDDALADSLARGALVVALYVVPAVFGAVKLFCHGPSSRS